MRNANNDGFSMVEIAIALLVAAIGLAAVFALFPAATAMNKKSIDDSHIGLFAEYVFNGFRHEARNVDWGSVDDVSSFTISGLATDYSFDNSPVIEAGPGIKDIRYNPISNPAIDEMAFRYEFRVYPVAGFTDVKAFVLNVWPGAFGVLTNGYSFYTEVYNFDS